MKNIYAVLPKNLYIFFMTLLFKTGYSQCPGGYSPGAVFYDTTVFTSSGSYSTQFKFPKFLPDSGVITCVRLCLTITGWVDMALENNVNSAATYKITYTRKDTLTGPGLTPPLTNQISVNYGPYTLAASDGVPFSGPDFISIGPDTVLQSVSMCRLLTDSVDFVPFYGTDSLVYNYNINAGAFVSGSGDYLFSVSTHGSVNFRLQYCFCPSSTLPLNVYNFGVKKIAADKAELNWSGFDDPDKNYHYEVEVSKNGHNFSTIGSLPKHVTSSLDNYSFVYAPGNEKGLFYFRIKQVYSNGYPRFSEIKTVYLENSSAPKINIYPNPSSGMVGIKFDNISSGKFALQISNAQGQNVFSKELNVSENSYRQITTLPKGMYWLKLLDVTSHLSCVNQLFIK